MPPSDRSESSLEIWLITDNKPGHKNQLEGLIQALSKKHSVIPSWIEIHSPDFSLIAFIKNLFQSRLQIDFCIGAGHKTHFYLVLCKLLARTKTIVLMKPSLPLSWFDLVVAPEHDNVAPAPNIIQTTGVINKIQRSSHRDSNKGLFLIGGPSKHFDWNNPEIIEQIQTIIQSQPTIHWQLTTSRRTPDNFIQQLQQKKLQLQIIPHSQTNSNWLPKTLAESGQVWVSEDSVSMIYEALTSGANTGLLTVPCRQKGRIQHGIEKLLKNQQLTNFNQWRENPHFPDNAVILNEADRIADLILHYTHDEQ